MNIAVIDADLIGRKKHRFPNLVSMKISGFHKSLGDKVVLKLDYKNLHCFDRVYISKVFKDTPIEESVLKLPNVLYGGTGFFYDKAPFLPNEIEHHMPDYHLYDEWVKEQLSKSKSKKIHFQYYTDWSIGFTTRYCFRKCSFCVNKNFNKVEVWSPLEEFVDHSRKYICLLDDNMLGSSKWKEILQRLNAINKPFQYKQGLDERLLTEEKINILFKQSKYKGDYIFAFDNIEDKQIIEKKLKLIRSIYKNKGQDIKFYVFCGFDRNEIYDEEFWKQDIINLFERIKILMKYNCLPYIMRFNKYEDSPYRGIYINIARWCNQPQFYTKKSYQEYCNTNSMCKSGISATKKYNDFFVSKHPEIVDEYFDLKFKNENKYLIN